MGRIRPACWWLAPAIIAAGFFAVAQITGAAYAADWEGSWESSNGKWVGTITYMFDDTGQRAWTEAEKKVVEEAIKEWEDLPDSDIDLEPVKNATDSADITIKWDDPPTGDGETAAEITGADGDDPPTGVNFNPQPDAGWYVDDDPTTDEPIPDQKWDLLSVAKHEIGHILGLKHVKDESASMDSWGPGDRQRLTESDQSAARNLYPIVAPEDIVPAGSDLFETDSSTSFQDFSETPIPASFFDPGSEPFAGTIIFKGVPIDPAQYGTTDTIVRRQTGALLPPPYPSSDTIPIELVELSLVSVEPIVVHAGSTTEVWDVKVGLSPSVDSIGEMTITKTGTEGGTFSSTLSVQPLFTFTRLTDGAVRQLDTGTIGLPPLEFVSSDVPWRRTCPPEVLQVPGVTTESFCASVDDEGKVLTEEQARLAKHGVKPGQPAPPAITTNDGFLITYTGPLEVPTGGTLEATFEIITPEGKPAKGTLAASLGDPPSDARASHASGELDAGKVALLFQVNWSVGTTKLYISHLGVVYEVTEITVTP
jgi:hypothetical protein